MNQKICLGIESTAHTFGIGIVTEKGEPLDFKKCLEVIDKTAWIDNKDYPLILFLLSGPKRAA